MIVRADGHAFRDVGRIAEYRSYLACEAADAVGDHPDGEEDILLHAANAGGMRISHSEIPILVKT